jgi:predicted GNAT family acetyltransferase
MLTLLLERAEGPEPGHYWIGKDGADTVGVVVQSPPGLFANVSRMTPEVAAELADTIAIQGITLPGVNGEAGAAATFAGQWSERLNVPAAPIKGLRAYVLKNVTGENTKRGQLRQATSNDRNVVLDLMKGFLTEVGEPQMDLELMVDRRLAAERFWLWENQSEAVCLVGCSEAAAGIVRIRVVYTPQNRRNYGYGTAATHALSKVVLTQGHRCMLYTDLGNPISNSIYRRIGYRAVAEALRYRFG